MFASLKLATIRGIPIRLHFSLLIVFGLMLFRFGLMGIPAGILLFGSVLLHELGHSVVAQRYGIRISSINLHLLGGMAMMTEAPRTPKQEMWIAAAGPFVSFLLGALFLTAAVPFGASLDFTQPGAVDLLAYGAALNMAMGLFNLVPALPMDGGRIFRAALQTRMPRLKATRIAATVSRGFGGLFIFLGLLWGQLSLSLIGLLLFFMVKGEERAAEAQSRMDLPPFPFVPMGRPAPQSVPGEGPVIDVGDRRPREQRRVFFDALGRPVVVVTRFSD